MAVVALGNTIYAIGGWTTDGTTTTVYGTVEAYDPYTQTWTLKADMPTPRYMLAAVAVNNMVLAIGGSTLFPDANGITTVEAYDPSTDTWSAKAPLPAPRTGLTAAVVGGTVYATGGCNAKGSFLRSTDAYDPGVNSWTPKASMKNRRVSLCSAVHKGKIYAIGGNHIDGFLTTTAFEEYNPATDTWLEKQRMPTSRGSAAAAVSGGNIFVAGGMRNVGMGSIPLSIVEVYDPVTNAWSTDTSLPVWRYGHGMVNLELKSTLFAVGGAHFGDSSLIYGDTGAALQATLAMTNPTPATGYTFTATLTISNTGLGTLANVTPMLGPNSGTAYATTVSGPDPPGPFGLIGGASQVVLWTFSATGAGAVRFTCTVTGLNACGATLVTPLRNDMVFPTARLDASLALTSRTLSPGQEVTASLTVTNTGFFPAYGVTGGIQVTPSQVVRLVPVSSTAFVAVLEPGGATTFTWTLTAVGPGTAAVNACATAYDGGGTGDISGCSASSIAVPAPPASGIIRVHPNPVNFPTAVRGTLKFEGMVAGATVRIYTASGLKVWEYSAVGEGMVEWNGRNLSGHPVAPGVYQWIVAAGKTKTRGKLVVE